MDISPGSKEAVMMAPGKFAWEVYNPGVSTEKMPLNRGIQPENFNGKLAWKKGGLNLSWSPFQLELSKSMLWT